MQHAGSGITMYVLSAGFSGITASFSVDGSTAIPNSVDAPPAPTYQTPNVSMFQVQGLVSGNHTMVMTVLDWNGSASSMKFDYALVNETFVAAPTTTSAAASTSQTPSASQTPTQSATGSASPSSKIDIGAVVGGVLAGVAFIALAVLGILYYRKRKAARDATYSSNPFMSEHLNRPPPQAAYGTDGGGYFAPMPVADHSIPPLTRSAILREALATGNHASSSDPLPSSQSTMSGMSSNPLQPLRRQPSLGFSTDNRGSTSYLDVSSPDTSSMAPHRLTAEQFETIDRLRADGVPAETIARVIEGFCLPVGAEVGGCEQRQWTAA
ncbi:hypothetical protein BU15DRAFT_79500 [Melanogaster broomeanus]|nr:hypothetical protein BU15DRAFT_79500 [Melanogaster broomeanus]